MLVSDMIKRRQEIAEEKQKIWKVYYSGYELDTKRLDQEDQELKLQIYARAAR